MQAVASNRDERILVAIQMVRLLLWIDYRVILVIKLFRSFFFFLRNLSHLSLVFSTKIYYPSPNYSAQIPPHAPHVTLHKLVLSVRRRLISAIVLLSNLQLSNLSWVSLFFKSSLRV